MSKRLSTPFVIQSTAVDSVNRNTRVAVFITERYNNCSRYAPNN